MVKDRPEPPSAPDSSGLSLDELSQAFATLLGDKDAAALGRGLSQKPETVPASPPEAATQEGDQQGLLSPRALVEAVLFVGRPDNLPITSEQIAGLSRQLTSQEIEEQIGLLNAALRRKRLSLRNRRRGRVAIGFRCGPNSLRYGHGYRAEIERRGFRRRPSKCCRSWPTTSL